MSVVVKKQISRSFFLARSLALSTLALSRARSLFEGKRQSVSNLKFRVTGFSFEFSGQIRVLSEIRVLSGDLVFERVGQRPALRMDHACAKHYHVVRTALQKWPTVTRL